MKQTSAQLARNANGNLLHVVANELVACQQSPRCRSLLSEIFKQGERQQQQQQQQQRLPEGDAAQFSAAIWKRIRRWRQRDGDAGSTSSSLPARITDGMRANRVQRCPSQAKGLSPADSHRLTEHARQLLLMMMMLMMITIISSTINIDDDNDDATAVATAAAAQQLNAQVEARLILFVPKNI